LCTGAVSAQIISQVVAPVATVPPTVYYLPAPVAPQVAYYVIPGIVPQQLPQPVIRYYMQPAAIAHEAPLTRPRQIERYYFSPSTPSESAATPINSTQPLPLQAEQNRGGVIIREYYYTSAVDSHKPAAEAEATPPGDRKLPVREPKEAFQKDSQAAPDTSKPAAKE
jgi:hypothetical protein